MTTIRLDTAITEPTLPSRSIPWKNDNAWGSGLSSRMLSKMTFSGHGLASSVTVSPSVQTPAQTRPRFERASWRRTIWARRLRLFPGTLIPSEDLTPKDAPRRAPRRATAGPS